MIIDVLVRSIVPVTVMGGALSPKGTREKPVTLDVAIRDKILQRTIRPPRVTQNLWRQRELQLLTRRIQPLMMVSHFVVAGVAPIGKRRILKLTYLRYQTQTRKVR